MNILYSNIFLVVTSVITAILAASKNIYISGLIKFIIDKIIINTRSTILTSYFYTWFIVLIYNMYASIFQISNFIILDENIAYAVLFIIVHFVMIIIASIVDVGCKTTLQNICKIKKNESIAKSIIQLSIMMIHLFTNLLLKPISILLRLVINVYMGNLLHHIFEEMKYGPIALEVITVIKFVLYIIQLYIILLLSNKVYQYLTHKSH